MKQQIGFKHLGDISKVVIVIFWILNIYTLSTIGVGVCFVANIIGKKCQKWSIEIKNNLTTAYFIGFLFGVFGLLGYWIYYNSKKENKKCN